MELLTRPEAARYLRLSIRKLDALAAAGTLCCSKFGNGKRARVVFRKDDLDRFVLEHLKARDDLPVGRDRTHEGNAGETLGGTVRRSLKGEHP